MRPQIPIKPLSIFARIADWMMVPIMYLLSGTTTDTPQQTHRWNNHHLRCSSMDHLEKVLMVCITGNEALVRQGNMPIRFHIPIFGGWKKYVVLEPSQPTDTWHIGWVSDRCGASRIPLHGRVRMLCGHGDVLFVGFDAQGRQIKLQKVGSGTIGQGAPYARLPLL